MRTARTAVANTASEATRRLSVGFVLAPNFTMLAFSAFVDTLRLAADEGDRSRPLQCSWSVLSHTMRPVRASSGIEVLPTDDLGNPTRYDYVIVVGGLLEGPGLPLELAQYLKKASDAGVPLIGVCTGSFILAQLGLLAQRRCCVSWFHIEEFTQRFAGLAASSDELFIDDGDRLTCAGGVSVVYLASHLVARHCGKAQADKALRIMITQSTLPAMALQPQPASARRTQDARVQRAMLLMERNLESPVSQEFVAQHVGISVRQLERLFKAEIGMSPTRFALEMRMSQAMQLLINSREPVFQIALRCGFVNRSHFASIFRSVHGQTPTQVRAAQARAPKLLSVDA